MFTRIATALSIALRWKFPRELLFLDDVRLEHISAQRICQQDALWHEQMRSLVSRQSARLRVKLWGSGVLAPVAGASGVLHSWSQHRFDGLSLLLANATGLGTLLFGLCAFEAVRFRRLGQRLRVLELHELQQLHYLEGVCPEAGHWSEHRRGRVPCQADLELAQQLYDQWRYNED